MAAELDLGAATIIELGERIRRRELSPVELIEATNARIERLQPLLHSFVTHCADYALERARQAEREIAANRYRGPLHGIPYTLKDVIATRGVRTTFGNPRGVDYRPPEQATLHRLLEEAGAILVGKVVSEIGRDTSGRSAAATPGIRRAARAPRAVAPARRRRPRWACSRSARTRAARCATRAATAASWR